MRNACKVLVTTPKRKRLNVRPRRRWENNVEVGLEGKGCDL